ncbi:hypothetical protein BDP55DRAFT_627205 [Colletotrichum godetiae]|uniref:Uncharacterized protein n=1 Tax=Colletotrichum godetiae TaxID=1209918 RepID=A0AAJ0AWE7_9PEZI|nr:uncharacterized protein BDP55DRAFT_627205 [Colletotrichum godetiae]KAK1691560.1 hypothetical protein BDP55DRAFT_627205 [Colletotrichum godetiae]
MMVVALRSPPGHVPFHPPLQRNNNNTTSNAAHLQKNTESASASAFSSQGTGDEFVTSDDESADGVTGVEENVPARRRPRRPRKNPEAGSQSAKKRGPERPRTHLKNDQNGSPLAKEDGQNNPDGPVSSSAIVEQTHARWDKEASGGMTKRMLDETRLLRKEEKFDEPVRVPRHGLP